MLPKFTIGFNFRVQSPKEDAVLIMRTDLDKITVNTVDGFFFADNETTANWSVGSYMWQIQDTDGVIEQRRD